MLLVAACAPLEQQQQQRQITSASRPACVVTWQCTWGAQVKGQGIILNLDERRRFVRYLTEMAHFLFKPFSLDRMSSPNPRRWSSKSRGPGASLGICGVRSRGERSWAQLGSRQIPVGFQFWLRIPKARPLPTNNRERARRRVRQ